MRVAQTDFGFDHLLCNRVGGECGSSPTLVFIHVLILTTKRKENKCNKIFLIIKALFNDKFIGALQGEIQNDGNEKLERKMLRPNY